jgi:hypothetical protein
MACYETGTVISLPAREAITLPHVGGATLRVTKGVLWLTEEDDRHDVVLRQGDNWLVESDGATVVEAQNDAVFCIVGGNAGGLELPARIAPKSGILASVAAFLAMPPRGVPYV